MDKQHATTSVANIPNSTTKHYCYDYNGNMNRRINGVNTDTFTYDHENRLTQVTRNGTTTLATYAYDGDGRRVKSVQGGVTTYYINDLVEYSGGVFTKFYYADGQRIAQRVGSAAPTYTLTDHLGSTRYTLNQSGAKTAEMRYYPWGSTHYSSNPAGTPRRPYTGQMNDGDTSLYYYNARYYEPGLARFVQADTIVPDPNNPQLLNRYSYLGNSPLNYVDPSGHDLMIITGAGDQYINDIEPWKAWIMAYKGWLSEEDWDAFKSEFTNSEDQTLFLRNKGIKFFDWTQCNCAEFGADNSRSAWVDQALPLLNEQLKGMRDITIIGFSKGANLAAHYANSQHARENPYLQNVISLQTPQLAPVWVFSSRSVFINTVHPENKLINVFNTDDWINDGGRGGIFNALNISYTEYINDHSTEIEGNGRLANFIFYKVTSVVGDSNASSHFLPSKGIGGH